ncbi:hypothetical protein PZ895_12040 [Mesorhizobium sp. YIM 152430]|jgi:hypothetical protein|uniref:hypothetical protein n=1 Tax=Phyllobacteriaceae TaxID=69277 RepID=UPI002094E7D3|nr:MULTISPECIES: hypothetical protein [Phyllobacteriaceae]MBL0936922.1 hypothetical protein [Rhizobiaceae bacterium]MCO6387812.1 hypothetical protein [Aliihoeflea sp. 40Bstr573]MDF1600490.1 hypothetical protein [Mesorhizobium sp. YIM 152430]
MNYSLNDIDAIIREEKRLTAVESHCEAWAEGLSAGIEPEIIAEAALSTALRELVKTAGEDSAVLLLEKMRKLALSGAFDGDKKLH